MMKRYLYLFVLFLSAATLAAEELSPSPAIWPVRTLTTNDRVLSNHTIWEIDHNLNLLSLDCNQSRLTVNSGDTAILHLKENVVVYISTDDRTAGIRVPIGAILIITGEKNSTLRVQGGSAHNSEKGDGGTGATVEWVWLKKSYTGEGGKGGNGGYGAGAAIGGEGGEGGKGAPKTDRLMTVKYITTEGNEGRMGENGKDGEGMGRVFVSGDVGITAIRGWKGDGHLDPAPRGNGADRGFFRFGWHRMNGGGGGGGGEGGVGGGNDYDIGGGGPGGGGGGSGSSGGFDEYNKKQTIGPYPDGEGGEGGEYYDRGSYLRTLHGENNHRQELVHHRPRMVRAGGRGGSSGKPGSNGALFTQKVTNLSEHTRTQRRQLVPEVFPIELKVRIHNLVEGAVGPSDFRFYYGMVPPEQITIPIHPDVANVRFGGYFTADGTLIYDKDGKITEKGKRVLYSWNHVDLYAYWAGPSYMGLKLRYELADPYNASNQWIEIKKDSFYRLDPYESRAIAYCQSDFLPKGYHIVGKDVCVNFDLTPNMQHQDSFSYFLNRHEMHWSIPSQFQNDILIVDSFGQPTANMVQVLPYSKRVVAPQLHYVGTTEAPKLHIIGWSNHPGVMPDSSIMHNELVLEYAKYMAYVTQSDSGQVRVENEQGDTISSFEYKQPVIVKVKANEGCYAVAPLVRSIVGGVLGDTIQVSPYGKDSTSYVFTSGTSVMITPVFKPIQYTIDIRYEGPALQTIIPHTSVVTSRIMDIKEADQAHYQGHDLVAFSGWMEGATDTLHKWVLVPVVTTPNGDTLKTQGLLSNELVKDSLGRKIWAPCYVFEAPNSNVAIEQTMYYRPYTSCTIFNHSTKGQIDSVFVNFNPVTLAKDSTTEVRSLDVVSIQVPQQDTSAVQAGYWDDEGIYHSLSVYLENVEIGGGDYATVASAIAPEKGMVMGLIDGLKILAVYTDTAVVWHAPSAATEGDTIWYWLETKHKTDYVAVDSVVVYDVNSQVVARYVGDEGWENNFVMPSTSVFAYVYTRVKDHFHTVTFLNANNDTLQQIRWLLKGDTISYHGNMPTLASDTTKYQWIFQGWTPQIHPVEGDDVYRATYRALVKLDDLVNSNEVLSELDGQVVDVRMTTYPMNPEYYYAVSFPFDLSRQKAATIWGEGTHVGSFTSTTQEDEKIYLNISLLEGDYLKAGTPYLMKPMNASQQVLFDSVKIDYHVDTIQQQLAQMRAILTPTWLTERDYNTRFVKNNHLYWPLNCTGPLRAYRAYFYLLDDEKAGPTDVYIKVDVDREGTQVDYIDLNGAADPYSGEEWDEEPTGLMEWIATKIEEEVVRKVIYRGELLIIRQGKVYNALGERKY